MNNQETQIIEEILQIHIKAEEFHRKKMEQDENMMATIRDPHNGFKEAIFIHRENHRQKMVIHRRVIKELAPLVNATVKFGIIQLNGAVLCPSTKVTRN